MSTWPSKSDEARRRAEEKFAKAQQRDTDVMDFQREIHKAETAKYTRLRALRLAKEAAEKEAKQRSVAEKAAATEQTKIRKTAKRSKVAPDEV